MKFADRFGWSKFVKQNSLVSAIVFVPTSFMSFYVSAQSSPESASSNPSIPTTVKTDAPALLVLVSGHYDNGIGSSDASSEGVVLGGLLQQRPMLRPGEVLETVPGLVVTQHSGDGKANQYFLRGYNLDHGTDFATSVDGVPVNMPSNAHGQGYSDLNFLVPELIDRISYRKGPYFADTGDFSSAGSANIKYVKMLEHDFADLTLGSFGYKRAVFAGSVSLSDVSIGALSGKSDAILLAGVELQENNGPWTVPEGFHKINGVLRLTEGTGASGWSVDANVYHAYWNSTDQIPLGLIQSGQLERYSSLDSTDGGNSGRDVLSGEWHQHDPTGYTRISGYLEHYRLQLWSDFTFFELRPKTGDQFEQSESRNILGMQYVKGWNHEFFGYDSVTEVGAQVRQDYIHLGLVNTQRRVPIDAVSDDMVSESELGVHVQNSTAWTNSFRTVAGARMDDIRMGMTSRNIPENDGHASGQRISPKLSMIFGPFKKTEFFINAGRGFHSNDARGVIDQIDPATRARLTQVPALVASIGKEIGLRTEIIPGLQSSFALWGLNSNSEIIYNADSAMGSTSPNGASRRCGVEWNNHLRLNNWVFFDADFAWTRARYATINDNGEMGEQIPNAVGKVGSFTIAVQPSGTWSGELNTRYIGSYPLSQDGTLTGPSAIVTNLRIQDQISKNLTLSLDILNLFNRAYYDIAYEQDYQVSVANTVVPNGITVHPGEPREMRMTLRAQF